MFPHLSASAVYTGVMIAAAVLIGAAALWVLVRRVRRAAPLESREHREPQEPSIASGKDDHEPDARDRQRS